MTRKNRDLKWSLILFALYRRGVYPLIPVPLWEGESFRLQDFMVFFLSSLHPDTTFGYSNLCIVISYVSFNNITVVYVLKLWLPQNSATFSWAYRRVKV